MLLGALVLVWVIGVCDRCWCGWFAGGMQLGRLRRSLRVDSTSTATLLGEVRSALGVASLPAVFTSPGGVRAGCHWCFSSAGRGSGTPGIDAIAEPDSGCAGS